MNQNNGVYMNFEEMKNKLVGKTLEQAKEITKELGAEMRVVSEDGVGRFLTADFRQNRVGVSLVKNLIAAVEHG